MANSLRSPQNVILSQPSPPEETATPSFQARRPEISASALTSLSHVPTSNLSLSHCVSLQNTFKTQPLLTSFTATTLIQATPSFCLLTVPPTTALHPLWSILCPTARVIHLKVSSDHTTALCKTFQRLLIPLGVAGEVLTVAIKALPDLYPTPRPPNHTSTLI